MARPTTDDVRRICLSLPEAEEVLTTSWRMTAPKRVVKAFDAEPA